LTQRHKDAKACRQITDKMEMLDKIGYAVCHQIPARSIFIDGKQLPVCARDTGLYFGSLISLIWILLTKKRRTNMIPVRYISFTLVFFMLLLAVDGISSYLSVRQTTNGIRLLTGLLVGISFPFFIYPILIDNIVKPINERQILKSIYDLLLILLLVTASYFLIYYYNFNLYYPIAFSVILGVFTLHYLLITSLLSLILFDVDFTKKIVKPLIIFPAAIMIVVTEFLILTKLHNLVNK
jgi:uncharacterized membrane protein